MRLDIYIHHVGGSDTERRIEQKEDKIMADLTQLTAAVARNNDVVNSALVLIQGLKAELDAAGTDPVALAALRDQLASSDDALAAAVAQNTPASP